MIHNEGLFHSALEARIVKRDISFFGADLMNQSVQLADAIKGSRCLFIGAGGSIGSNTLDTVLSFEPEAIYVIDHDENGLAELIRSLRSQDNANLPNEFVTLPFDYGGPVFRDWYESLDKPFDHILNFAALKHVRSEKDPYSILAMLDTNVTKLARLQSFIGARKNVKRLFCVSTDKAANPSSMMGATKKLMEHALFLSTDDREAEWITSSARFANVAFSNGSLLQSWKLRLQAGQPLACPEGCRRFFVSLKESGHLCTLAAFLAEKDQIFIPNMDPKENLVLLEDIVSDFLAFHNYQPIFMKSEVQAKLDLNLLKAQGKYPVLLTPLNTSGEKPYEEFVAAGETLMPTALASLSAVQYKQPADPSAFDELIIWLETRFENAGSASNVPLNIIDLQQLIGTVEPEFLRTYRTASNMLDERM